jgi:hypothetical protein
VPRDQWRRIRGEQEIIARYEPEQAIATLPALLADRADRERLLTLLDKLMADQRVQEPPTDRPAGHAGRIREVLKRIAPPRGSARSRRATGRAQNAIERRHHGHRSTKSTSA